MFAIGNNELNQLPDNAFEGMILQHQHEDGSWEDTTLEYGTSNGIKSSTLGFYILSNGETYLASVAGKLLHRPTLRIKIIESSN